MNNAQEMSPDFVLMRLVSAEDEENGNVSPGGMRPGLGEDVLTRNMKGGLGFAHSHLSLLSSSSGTTAPDAGVMATRSPPVSFPPPHGVTEAQSLEFSHRGGLRPQLLVFPSLLRDGDDGVLDCEIDRRNHGEQVGLRTSVSASDMTGGNNNNAPGAGESQQKHPAQPWGLHPRVTLSSVAADMELCHRHRLITDSSNWSLLSEPSNPFAMMESKWGCASTEREGSVFDLARRFGELGVRAVPKMLFQEGELPPCSCRGAHGSEPGGLGPGDDPAETSDALLVLEGLGTGDMSGLGTGDVDCPEDAASEGDGRTVLLSRNSEIVQKMSAPFSLSSFQEELSRQVEGVAGTPCPARDTPAGGPPHPSAQTPLETRPGVSPAVVEPNSGGSSSPSGSLKSTPRRQTERCVTSPGRGSAGDKIWKVPGKTRKGSLKIRLSKLFRTKSCSGSSNLLDKRPSLASSISSTGSLLDMGGSAEQDTDSQPRLTRAHSAFSPASFSAFTGETVSLVDVDISRRRANTPHPPTPPPPPRRSLSLLDDIGGPQPGPFLVSVVGASLQSLPLPLPPPPSHATMQHSVSLNDAFLRVLPHTGLSREATPLSRLAPPPSRLAPPPSRLAPPPLLCPLRRPEASNFTASLRELEKCGWYWGPMTWEDAELKLKGKHDGSFLVRDSSDPRYILSLSFRSQAVTHHTRMEHYRGTFSLWCHPKFEDRCHSVVEFIERAIMHSKNGKFLYFLRSRVPGLPPTPVQLLHPVSRFSRVKSLQHLCRFALRQMVRVDHIQDLPLPRPLICYLRKFYYYDPEEETYLSIKRMCSRAGPERGAESHT